VYCRSVVPSPPVGAAVTDPRHHGRAVAGDDCEHRGRLVFVVDDQVSGGHQRGQAAAAGADPDGDLGQHGDQLGQLGAGTGAVDDRPVHRGRVSRRDVLDEPDDGLFKIRKQQASAAA